ncbi:MAG: hypothetical protein JKY43_03845 [Phycisphaerales bacterium]|nr:hypothetical protein [Phycisphaerales bacterium]
MKFNQRTDTLSTLALIAGLAVSTTFSPKAMAQNALGDGRGLAANPRQGSDGRVDLRPSFQKEVAYRNAIATGNAPGGMSFRGDLGYRAAGEFSGTLGSDALYSFRRDSLYSGLAGMGIRGTDALQYQFAMTTGSRITRNMTGSLSLSRLGGSSSAAFNSGIGQPEPTIAIDPMLKLRQASSRVSGTLRSTSSYASTTPLVPELISIFERGIEQEQFGLVASPLMGLVSTPMDSARNRRLKKTTSTKPEKTTEPEKNSYSDTIEAIRARAETIRARNLESATNPDTASDQENPDQTTDEWIALQLHQLQRQLLGLPESTGKDEPVEVVQQGEDPSQRDDNGSLKIRDPLNPHPDDQGQDNQIGTAEIEFTRGQGLAERSFYTIDPETLEIMRGDRNKVTYLIDPTAANRNIYSEHMTAGQQLLTHGRYFDAEERFTQALSIRQGDVSAQLGRLHAQIGAGLVISASINLQTLMSEHLEVVSRQYSGNLLPKEQRLRELLQTLRERARLEERPSYIPTETTQVRLACGLLIAYLGYQINDQQQMNDGFSVIRKLGTESDLRLVLLLDTVWSAILNNPTDTQTPTPDEPAP